MMKTSKKGIKNSLECNGVDKKYLELKTLFSP